MFQPWALVNEKKKIGKEGDHIHLNFDSVMLNNIRFHENQFSVVILVESTNGAPLRFFPLEK